MMVMLGSRSARAWVTRGSSVPVGVLVTSKIPLEMMGASLQLFHQLVVVFHVLHERNVEHGTRRLLECESRELGVAYDADDTKCSG